MNLNEKIQVERNRVTNEIEKLQKQNDIDVESLDALKEDYNKALFSSDSNDIDFVNSQIKEVSIQISRRKEKIEALQDKNNPFIQSMIMEEATKWMEELKNLEQQAKEKDSKLQDSKKKFVAALLELNDMRNRSVKLRYCLNHWREQLNEMNQKDIGLSQHLDALSPIVKQMRSLLIQDREVFK